MTSLTFYRGDKEEKTSGGSYSYFDTPDGEDCLKKLIFCTKNAGFLGLVVSSFDALMYSHPKGYGALLGRYAYITIPITAMGAAFSAATCAATNIRKQDDKINYAIGGFAVGAVWGAWKKSYKFGIYGGFALAAFAAVVKDSYQNNWYMLGRPMNRIHRSPYWIRQDWSILSDPGQTWKRGDE